MYALMVQEKKWGTDLNPIYGVLKSNQPWVCQKLDKDPWVRNINAWVAIHCVLGVVYYIVLLKQ